MARLPMQGSDVGNWGEILNDFLLIEHNPDGSLRHSGSLGGKYTLPAGGIPRLHLAGDVQAALARADIALTEVPVFTKSDVGLGNVTNEAQLPLTGGSLTGNLYIMDGRVLRLHHTADKFVEVKTDAFWSGIYASGTSGLTLGGATVRLNAAIVTTTGRVALNSAVDQANSLDVATSVGITRALADTNGPALSMYKRGTTGDAAAAVRSGNNIFALQGFGYHGTGYSHQGTIVVNATQDWTAGARGTSMSFLVTPNGSTVRMTALTIGQNSQLTVNGDISLTDGRSLILSTLSGSRIGTTASQKLGFYGATPVARPTGVTADPASLHAALVSLGLIAA